MRLLEIFKGKQDNTEPDKKEEVNMVNKDQVHAKADEELTSGVAKHTGQSLKEVIPLIAQSPDLEVHKSGIPQFRETPRVTPKPSAAVQVEKQAPSTLPHVGVVTKIVGQGARDIQRGVTGEHIEEPPSFQPAKPALDLHAGRTLEKTA